MGFGRMLVKFSGNIRPTLDSSCFVLVRDLSGGGCSKTYVFMGGLHYIAGRF